jgi:single-stranded-DNA-specific exonuclease
MLMKGMDLAVDRIVKTMEDGGHILIYGDFDADGLTATAILKRFFFALGIKVSSYVPHRFKEGYGLNEGAIRKAVDWGVNLIITVDCGIAGTKEIALAEASGIKVVVTDHHRIPEGFHPICPVVNPLQHDSPGPFMVLAGVGIAFYLAIAIRARLRDKGWFSDREEPDLRDYLDLVALGTIADMVPLRGQNRVLVRSGLERMRASKWPGLNAIKRLAGVPLSNHISAEDLAFRIAPRLNASGRMGNSHLGLQILMTEHPDKASNLAQVLDTLNAQRQQVEQGILQKAERMIESLGDLRERRSLVLAGDGWHRGVLGIVASKLVAKYHRPTLVLGVEDGKAVGSGRSIAGFDLQVGLSRLRSLIEKFGGHYHAAGLTVESKNVSELAEKFEALAEEQLSEEDLRPSVEVDGEVNLEDLTRKAMNSLEVFKPFGTGNPTPVFYSQNLEIRESRVVGKRHLKLKVKQERTVMDGIGFGLGEGRPLVEKINAVFSPEINHWRGLEKIQLRIVDFEPAGGETRLKICPWKTQD